MPNKLLTYKAIKKWGTALLLSGAVFTALPLTAYGDQSENNRLDAITLQVMQDAFIALRFAALALDEDDEAGQALEGLVRAMLSRGEFEDALKEANRIDDDIWFARAMISISHHLEEQADIKGALNHLTQGLKRIGPKNTSQQAEETRRTIALNRAVMGDLEGAQFAASQIQDQFFKINTLQLSASAHQKAANYSAVSKTASAKVLRQAYLDAAKLEIKSQSLIDIFLEIGHAQALAGDIKGAKSTYKYALDRAVSGENKGRFGSYAKLASALTYIDDHRTAMQVLRKIDEGGDRGVALSAVARSMAGANKVDAALPLFTLAFEQSKNEKNLDRRYAIYAQIVDDQTTIGRLADAFTTAGAIKDRYMQSLALLRMGENLISQGKFEEAYVLIDYIPYIGMRAQIFAAIAGYKSINPEDRERNQNPTKVSAYLIQGLENTGFDPSLDHIPDALHAVLSTQLAHGDPEMDMTIFNRVEELTFILSEPSQQVDGLTYLATAQAQRNLTERTNKTISSAWRISWQNKYEPMYPSALAKITQSQIAVQDVLSAFDTAARIPKPNDDKKLERASDGSFRAPRFDALTSVAVAAAQIGDSELAIRAARQIRFPPAQAAALAAIAVAIAAPEKPLREIVGIGPTDINPYDLLTVKYTNSDKVENKPSEEAINIQPLSN